MHVSKSSPITDQSARSAHTPNSSSTESTGMTLAERRRAGREALGRWSGLFGECVRRLWVALVKRRELKDLYEFSEPIRGCRVRRIPPEEITTDERMALGLS
jgi:hypothetical protein